MNNLDMLNSAFGTINTMKIETPDFVITNIGILYALIFGVFILFLTKK